jgi:hypothetical protein
VEIVDYFHIARRRWWILLIVPLLAAVATVGYSLAKPGQYVARVVVAAPALIGGSADQTFSGSNAVQQFVDNFVTAATTPVVVERVAADTHVTKRSVLQGLRVRQVDASSQLTVTFTSTRARTVGPVATAAARETLGFLFATQVTLRERSLASAQKSLQQVQAQMTRLESQAGAVAPDRAAELLSQQIATLQQQQLQLSAGGNAAGAAGLAATIALKQQQLAALAPAVRAYERLVTRQSSAVSLVQAEQQDLAAAKEQQAAADPSVALHVGRTHSTPRVSDALQKIIPAAGAGLFLAAGLVLALEAVRARRRTGTSGYGALPVPIQGAPVPSDNGAREGRRPVSTRP